MPSWKERYGYPAWYVWALFAAILAVPGSIIMVFISGNLLWLLPAFCIAMVLWAALGKHDAKV